MLHRLREVYSILERLPKMRERCRQQSASALVQLQFEGSPRILQIRASTVVDVGNLVEDGIRDTDLLRATIDWLSSYMYPTEDYGSDDLLEFFREKEWRITNYIQRADTGEKLTSKRTAKEKTRLRELSSSYFGLRSEP